MKKLKVLFCLILSISVLVGCIYVPDEKLENTDIQKKVEEQQEEPEEEQKELTEEEYKALCEELYYDEVFFGDENLEGKYVKLHLMLSEKFYFTADAMYSDTWLTYAKKYSINRDFYKCCVLRENQNSYVGKQITMWFSDKNGIDPNNYDVGNKVTVYAEVISWGKDAWDGFNNVTIIPKYME